MTGDDSGSSDDSGPGRERPRAGGPADESDDPTGDEPRGGPPGDSPSDGGSDDRVEDDGPDERPDGEPAARPGTRRGEGQSSERPRAPPRRRSPGEQRGGRGVRWWVHRFRTAQSGPLMIAREVLSSVLMVAAVGLFLFAVSGVWPPMVAVQSGSMEPHMEKGDLVFVVDENRFADDVAVQGTGVAPHAVAEEDGYVKFGTNGDVIIYEPDGSTLRDPIIHRAMFWVDEGENWYDEANQEYVRADSCQELNHCPAPNSGFITKGDDNPSYDQAQDMSRPVKPEWITGKAMIRIPALGWIRLIFSSVGQGSALLLGGVFLGSGLGLRRRRFVP